MPKPFAILVAMLLAVTFVPFGALSATAADDVTFIPGAGENCNGVKSTPGSENTTKNLIGGDLQPGGTAVFRISYPVSPLDEDDVFVLTDCFVREDTGGELDKFEIRFVPNNEDFEFEYTVNIPAGVPLGTEVCNYIKTTEGPSASPASNRKGGVCFTVGGTLRIEKRDAQTNALLNGAKFTVSCAPTVEFPAVVISGLESARPDGTPVTGNPATGYANEGFIAIAGPEGTSCTVTELEAPPGYVLPADTSETYLIPRTGSADATKVFLNTRTGSLTISKKAVGAAGTFTFDVDCTGTAYDRTGDNPVVLQVDAGQTQTQVLNNIPTGTICTVTERNSPLFSTVVVPANGTVTIDPDGETVSFTNTRLTGALKITKIANAEGTFSFDVDCSDDTFDRSNIIITIGAGQVGSPGISAPLIEGIPTGVTCTVTEDSNPQFSTTVTPEDGEITIATGTNTVTFTNTRNTGGLTISKTTVGGAGTFVFDVDCEGTAYDRTGENPVTLVVSAGGTESVTLSGIPTGTVCTVTERSNPDFTKTAEVPANGTVTIDGNGETVSFTNTRNTGGLTISKTTVGGAGTFVFDVDCEGTAYDRTGENPVTLVVSAGGTESVTLSGIPTGTVCTVTERSNPDFTKTAEVPANGTVTIDGNGETVSFTNTRNTGDLTITKAAVGGSGTFIFDVDCSDDDFDFLGEDAIVLEVAAGDTEAAIITDVPTGTECTVTERSNALFSTVVIPADGTVTIDGDGESVAFTNTRNTGALTISKAALGGAGTFVFDVDCDGSAYDRTGGNPVTIQVAAGATQTAVLSGIPTGTVCVVTERSNPAFVQTAVVPGNGTVTIDGNGETVSFTNTLRTGALNISKAVSPVAGGGTVIEFGDTLTYTLTVSATGNLTQENVVVKDYIPGYDPARPSSGNTTYVTGSAACVGGGTCNVSYSSANHQITWGLGNMAPGTTRQVTFKVTIDSVQGDPGETVAVDILNAGSVQSTQTPVKPSNEVKTTVTEVFPVKNARPPKVLPHTGAGVEPGLLAAGAISFLSLGLLLMAAGRRRRGGAHRA